MIKENIWIIVYFLLLEQALIYFTISKHAQWHSDEGHFSQLWLKYPRLWEMFWLAHMLSCLQIMSSELAALHNYSLQRDHKKVRHSRHVWPTELRVRLAQQSAFLQHELFSFMYVLNNVGLLLCLGQTGFRLEKETKGLNEPKSFAACPINQHPPTNSSVLCFAIKNKIKNILTVSWATGFTESTR